MNDTIKFPLAALEQLCNQIDTSASDEIKRLERERDEARELRNGDNQLIMALAEAVGIAITCNPKMLGIVWEQFHDGVLELKRERDEAREALKKCREDSVCYAEHMRRSGYVKAFKESQENADKAMGILNKLEGAK
jgi:uncharacterized coiled-coil DUF342 family protein